ncbi:MAG: selenium-dependent xanthine dehydrogenase, partial [Actinomycetota bacterium]|nr:selenium-dependent xanthine dehydrogenase [Actinomycetota bacterium]
MTIEAKNPPGTALQTDSSDRVAFVVNGTPVTVRRDHPHLLAALREELDITSPKDGCSPSGQCGCCTVLVDGKAIVSCQQSVDKVADTNITTLEGVSQNERDAFANAFAACGGLQCGFCIPGIIVRAKAQIDKKGAALKREDMARHLGAHLCRCTGYVKILDAIDTVAKNLSPEIVSSGGLGVRVAKYEANELALGDRGYIDDMRITGLLHASLVFTKHARAEVLSIDTSEALSRPGVKAVFTAQDIPGELMMGIIYKDWPVMIPVGGFTSYAGDVLAIVVADSRLNARNAIDDVVVEYKPLTPITDARKAIASNDIAVWKTDSNVLSKSAYSRGDVDSAFASSAHVVRETFSTQRIEHAFLEPESTLAVPSLGDDQLRKLHVYSGGQGVWDDRNDIARLLAIPNDQVTVTLVTNGGAFGGKEDMSNQAHASLAAWLLDKPVKCTLSREESFLMHAKRHPIEMTYEAACDQDGKLTALRVRAIGDSGAYASVGMKVLERMAGHASGPYQVPNIDVEAIAARTNNPICGAFRGFGANQAQFAMEGVLDRLAEKVGISGWQIRSQNVIKPGMVWGPGQIMDDGCLGAELCLNEIKPAYDNAVASGKAVGLGLGLKNSGLGNGFKEISKAIVRFKSNGRIEVRHGWTEMGQGINTVAAQVAVEELGVDAKLIDVIVDTSRELGFGQTTGSRGTLMGAGAVKNACQAAIAANRKLEVDHVGEYRVDWTNKLGEPGVTNPIIHSTFSYAAQMVIIDRETQKIEKVFAVHDVGRVVNPTLCEGQVEGSVHMGLGYALTENFPSDPDSGFPINKTLRSLGILRAKDVPPIEVKLLESPQPNAPYGIKGVGEIGLVPTAGAVAAALHELDGQWRFKLPMRQMK